MGSSLQVSGTAHIAHAQAAPLPPPKSFLEEGNKNTKNDTQLSHRFLHAHHFSVYTRFIVSTYLSQQANFSTILILLMITFSTSSPYHLPDTHSIAKDTPRLNGRSVHSEKNEKSGTSIFFFQKVEMWNIDFFLHHVSCIS